MPTARKGALLGALLIFVILISDVVRASILNSILLCLQNLIPALLPSFVLCGMLLDCGVEMIFPPAWAAFLIGLVCGYPIGSSSVCRLYNERKLDKTQAEGLLACTANASPAFVIVVIGTLLENKALGYTLWFLQILVATLLFIYLVPRKTQRCSSQACSITLATSLIQNIKKTMEQLFFVCGCTIVFGIFFDVLSQTVVLHSKTIKTLIACMELTHGLTLYGNEEIYSVATILGFSGFAILTQCAYYVQQTDLRFRFVLIGKILYAAWMPLILYLLQPHVSYKIPALIIFILTNVLTACIIRPKGCEKENDFFKRNRKMLCLLRKSNKDHHERTGPLPS